MRDKELRETVEGLRKRIQDLETVLRMGFRIRSFTLDDHEKAIAKLAEINGIKRRCTPNDDQSVIWDLINDKRGD